MKIKKGDRVRVLTGKDRGKEGVVMFALPREGKVIVEGVNRIKKHTKVVVEGVNTAKRHTKSRTATESGGIHDKDMPIQVSNVAVISPSDGKPTRVGYRFTPEGEKVRVCKRTGADL